MNIVKTGRLRPTEARQAWGGALAVRAITMKENLSEGDQGRATIEFYAKDAPRTGTASWLAEWRLPEGEELEIEVVRVLGLVRPEDL